MNTSADAADQVVRMSLNGAEVALKVSGKGAEKAAILIYHALKNAKTESKKTRGAIRLANLARSGKKPDERSAIKALIKSSPCQVVIIDELKESTARYPDKNTIFIVRELEANGIFRSLAFEFGIAKCYQNGIERKDAMFPAYCSAYILCERNGFETGDFNFEKVPEQFKDKESKDIRKELGAVRDMANDISQDISREIEAIEKGNRTKDNGAR